MRDVRPLSGIVEKVGRQTDSEEHKGNNLVGEKAQEKSSQIKEAQKDHQQRGDHQ